MRPTLRDVAAHANVSVKTVSNVVNGYPFVSPETLQRVRQSIEALGYRPNLSARSLRSGRTGVVALAVPFLDMPYFAELAGHIIEAADERGWTVLVDQTNGDRERELMVVGGIRDHLIDGLIFSPLALTPAELHRNDGATPLVLLGERIQGGPADHISIDNVKAAADATRHLISLGRRRIAAIGVQQTDPGLTASLRQQGWTNALTDAGISTDRALRGPADRWGRVDGYTAMIRLLDSRLPLDAVFCFNDLLALGAIHAAHERGLRIPEDVAVIGFDDIEDGQFSYPTLSTIAPDKNQIARVAVDLLAGRIGGGTGAAEEIVAGHLLTIRHSTAGIVRPPTHGPGRARPGPDEGARRPVRGVRAHTEHPLDPRPSS